MGTNTMVAAIGLVLGPVLGGALVGISWHWVFWFNVPLALLGAAWAGSGPARAGHPRHRPRPRPPRHPDLRRRPDRARLRDLARRHLRLERLARDRQLARRRRPAAGLRPDRAPRRRRRCSTSSIFQQPALRRRHRGRLHQRALALRADVHLRLLLPGRPGRRRRSPPGSSWRRWRSGCWSPRRSPASTADRHGSRALAAIGMLVTAARARPDDHPAGRHSYAPRQGCYLAARRDRLGDVQLARTPRR